MTCVPLALVIVPDQSPKPLAIAPTVTGALLITEGSSTDATITVAVPVVPPAVNKPELEIVPSPATLHVTAELKFPVPAAVALNCSVCPETTFADAGVMVTEVTDVGAGGVDEVGPPPQPTTDTTPSKTNHRIAIFLLEDLESRLTVRL
jgi:hypothetical protein